MPDDLTLALEASSPAGSLCLARGTETLARAAFDADRAASELFAALERLAGHRTPPPSRIVAGIGPGSYSGIRIALAAATGLARAWNASLLGIPSLLALPTDAPRYRILGDARRGGFFTALIHDRRFAEPPRIVEPAEAETIRANPDAPLFRTQRAAALDALPFLAPCAELLARLADTRPDLAAPAPLEPLYLRPPHVTRAKDTPTLR